MHNLYKVFFGLTNKYIFFTRILYEFLILPLVIRYKTWSYLFERDKRNIQVANKLCLAIIKIHFRETSFKWIEENSKDIKRYLIRMSKKKQIIYR